MVKKGTLKNRSGGIEEAKTNYRLESIEGVRVTQKVAVHKKANSAARKSQSEERGKI